MDPTDRATCSRLSIDAQLFSSVYRAERVGATVGDKIRLNISRHLLRFAAVRILGQHALVQQQRHFEAGLVEFCWCCALAAHHVGVR